MKYFFSAILIAGLVCSLFAQTTNKVGSLPGMFSVAPNGVATYTIPIEIPKGRMGMEPQLAFVYNSSGGQNIMGQAWSIAGFSSITRSNSTNYYSGKKKTIDFENDEMLIDGEHLIRKATLQDGIEYRTEIDEFSKIIFNNPSDEFPHGYFIVYRKNGTIAEYGSSNASVQYYKTSGTGINLALTWHIAREYDRNNNMIEYNYGQNYELGEIHPLSIEYTNYRVPGKAPLSDNYRIVFNYDRNGYSPEYQYMRYESYSGPYNNVEPFKLKITDFLASVSIEYNSKLLKQYSIDYYETENAIAENYFVKSIKLSVLDENSTFISLNETKFEWQFYCPDYKEMPGGHFENKQIATVKIIALDFFGNNKDVSAILRFKRNDDGISPGVINIGAIEIPLVSECFACDFEMKAIDWDLNGDDELIISDSDATKIYDYDINTKNYTLVLTLPKYSKFDVGDYNGDDIIDIIALNSNRTELRLLKGSLSATNTLLFSTTGITIPLIEDNYVSSTDFNADGIMDIITKRKTSHFYTIYSFVDDTFKKMGYENLGTCDGVSFNDFNGDGKIDICKFSGLKTTIYFGYGFDFIESMDEVVGISNSGFKCDFNNDGRTDCAMISFSGSNIVININYTLPCGTKTLSKTNTFPINTSFDNLYSGIGDFDGNGIFDIILGFEDHRPLDDKLPGYSLLTLKMYYDNSIGRNVITQISDGHDVVRVIEYQKFNNYSNSFGKFPIIKARLNELLVKESFVVGDNSNKLDRKEYKFHNPRQLSNGKGFMGFTETNIISYLNSEVSPLITKEFYEILHDNGKYYYLHKSKTEKVINNNLIYEQRNFLSFIPGIPGTLNFYPAITKTITKEWENNQEHTYKGIIINNQPKESIDLYGNPLYTETIKDENLEVDDPQTYSWRSSIHTEYEYDEANWLINRPTIIAKEYYHKQKDPNIAESITEKYLIEYIKNRPYLVDSIIMIPNGSDNLTKTVKYNYDIYGNMTREVTTGRSNLDQPDYVSISRVSEFEYDLTPPLYGRFMTKSIEKAPTPNNDIVKHFEYDVFTGNLLNDSIMDVNSNSTLYMYDEFERLTEIVNPDLTKIEKYYKWASDCSDFTPPTNALYYTIEYKKPKDLEEQWNKTYVFYDKYGREINKISKGYSGNLIAQQLIYDKYGRLLKTSMPFTFPGIPTQFETCYYDDLGREYLKELPNQVKLETIYNGRVKTINNLQTEEYKSIIYNMIGTEDVIEEKTGYICNSYDAAGQILSVITNGTPIHYEYDEAGNMTKIINFDAGTTVNTYNAFGELETQTYPDGTISIYRYDYFGRLINLSNNNNEQTNIDYIEGKDQLGFTNIGDITKTFSDQSTLITNLVYDSFNRNTKKIEKIDNRLFETQYLYNQKTGEIENMIYPSGLIIKYIYNSEGYMSEVRNGTSNNLLWNASSYNNFGLLTSSWYGLNISHGRMYSDLGLLNSIRTQRFVKSPGEEEIQSLSYNFDPLTGNLISRSDNMYNLQENFSYDDEFSNNRLTGWSVNSQTQYSINYELNGNIQNKSDVTELNGNYGYNISPHFVSKINEPTINYINEVKPQRISYNHFNHVDTITQDINGVSTTLQFEYNSSNKRIRTNKFLTSNLNTAIESHYYLSNYEEIVDWQTGTVKKLNFLISSDGVFGVIDENDKLFYIFKDHQSSYNLITDVDGNVIERLSFDPWGRRRNPVDWSFNNVPSTHKFAYGYTSHEHLDDFGLINMGGRLYDPFVARFLSPDPVVQNPHLTDNYNLYTYALNNPLKYIDPSGYNYKPWYWNQNTSWAGVNIGRYNMSPGSGNHYSDSFRSREGNFYLMSQKTFDNIYGPNSSMNYINNMNLEKREKLARPDVPGVWLEEVEVVDFNGIPGSGRLSGGIPKWWGNYGGDLDGMDIANYIASNLGTIAGGAQYGINSMSNKQQWKYSYKISKYFKGNSINIQTRAIKHGFNGILKNASRKITYVGGILAIGDIAIDGELRASHLLNVGMVGMSAIPVAGWIIGGSYFMADMITLGISGRSIGQHLDNAIGAPLVDDIYNR